MPQHPDPRRRDGVHWLYLRFWPCIIWYRKPSFAVLPIWTEFDTNCPL